MATILQERLSGDSDNLGKFSSQAIHELQSAEFNLNLTRSDFHFRNQNVLEGAIFFFWNQYSNIARKKLSN